MKPILLVFICFLSLSVKSQIITTFAGNGTSSGVVGDGGPATNASINGANGGAFDRNGNYYVADILGHRIRKVTPAGIITTVAGTGSSGSTGDGGVATLAKLNNPTAVVVDSFGNLYIADLDNKKIRKVDVVTGQIITIAGTGVLGYNGDNISATNAEIGAVQDIYMDKSGNLYLADQTNYRVRKINTSGIITTIAGSGGFSATGTGDGGPATNATFNWISTITVDDEGNVYIGDMNSATIRKVNTSGIITTIAGNGTYTYIGDNIPVMSAQFSPGRITSDRSKNLVIADKVNRRVYKIDNAGIFRCIAGNGTYGFGDDGVEATATSTDFPAGVVYDTCGNLYIAESTNRRVRKVSFNPSCIPLGVQDMSTNNVGEVLLYPNPASGEITVEGSGVTKVALCNVLGQVVYEMEYKKADKVMVDISHLPPGIYMVRVNDVWVGKVVKE
jgi:hypothetical protein